MATPLGRTLAVGTAAGLAGLGFGYGSNYLLTVTVSRVLEAEAAGGTFVLIAIVNLLALVARLGMDRLALKRVSVASEAGHWIVVDRAFQTTVVAVLVASSVLAVFVAGSGSFLSELLGPSIEAKSVVAAAAGIPGVALAFTVAQVLRGLRRMLSSALIQLILPYGTTAVLVLLLGSHRESAVAFSIGAFAVASWLSACVGIAILVRLRGLSLLTNWTVGQGYGAGSAMSGAGRAHRVSPWMFTLTVGLYAMTNIDVVIISALVEPSDVAIYVVALRTALLAALGVLGISGIGASIVASLYEQGSRRELQDALSTTARWSLALASVVVGVVLVSGAELIPLVFGRGFTSAFVPTAILCMGPLVNALVGAVSPTLQMSGNERPAALVVLGSLVFLLVAMPFAARAHGLIGISIAVAAAHSVQHIGLAALVRSRLGVVPTAPTALRSLAFVATCLLLGRVGEVELAVSLPLFFIVAPPLAWFTLLDATDRRLLAKLHQTVWGTRTP